MNPYNYTQLLDMFSHKKLDVLFSCESGSRAWGFESRDSDYDVRFVYLEPQAWHLSLKSKKKDTQEFSYSTAKAEIDVSGWELGKFLKLMRKSNASVFDWLSSPIVYYERDIFTQVVRPLVKESFSPGRVSYHALNLARQHFNKYVLGRDEVGIKKYLYITRALLMVDWMFKYKTYPPVLLTKLVKGLYLLPELSRELWHLVEMKNKGQERTTIPSSPFWNAYAVTSISNWEKVGFDTEKIPNLLPYDTVLLNLLADRQAKKL